MTIELAVVLVCLIALIGALAYLRYNTVVYRESLRHMEKMKLMEDAEKLQANSPRLDVSSYLGDGEVNPEEVYNETKRVMVIPGFHTYPPDDHSFRCELHGEVLCTTHFGTEEEHCLGSIGCYKEWTKQRREEIHEMNKAAFEEELNKNRTTINP